jgi:hypothetical protein
MRLASIVLLVIVACSPRIEHPQHDFRCLSGSAMCPNQPRFTCAPTNAVFGGCSGVPALFQYKPSSHVASMKFPVGCTVELPAVNPFYQSKQTCTCDAGGMFRSDRWSCPV